MCHRAVEMSGAGSPESTELVRDSDCDIPYTSTDRGAIYGHTSLRATILPSLVYREQEKKKSTALNDIFAFSGP